MATDRNVTLFGTTEASLPMRSVQLGSLSMLFSTDGIRRIKWHGVELVRAITWPIRDENWGTYQPAILDAQFENSKDTANGHIRFSVARGRLVCALEIHATDAGELRLDLTMTPKAGGFATNRAGFTLLHPITGITGAPVEVTHSNGDVEQSIFPRLISPTQPVVDISRLKYQLGGAEVDIGFHGDVFEMEDQRNWSDASYKTYCVPLKHPFTYRIDHPVSQTLRISLSGEKGATAQASDHTKMTTEPSGEVAVDIGLVVEPGWIDSPQAVEKCNVSHVRARIEPDQPAGYVTQLADAARGRQMDVELVIADKTAPHAAFASAKRRIETAGIAPNRIIALPEGYLSSHQPCGPWPNGSTPAEIAVESRAAFPESVIGGGMLTNFTELNRCRPNPEICDFMTHGNTAIVHASDDLSVCETLEALPQVFESARSVACDTPYRLGLVSIGMRSNPYGASVAENPSQVRRTMAREDPRQRGLFAAAWAVGALAGTEGHGVESICLAAPTGPFGVFYAKQRYPQAYFDEAASAEYYPIFHIVKSAARMSGSQRLRISGLPAGVFAYGVKTANSTRLMVANVTPSPQTVGLPAFWRVAILDENSFANSTTQENWLDTTPREQMEEFDLGPYAVAFVEN